MIQRTKVITLILFGLLFTNLSAQEGSFNDDKVANLADDDRTYRFGLQFSPNISWIKTNSTGYLNDGSKVGFSYGLSFEYFMTKNYLFSTGIGIVKGGGSLIYENKNLVSNDIQEDFKLKYIEVPLLIKMRTNEIGYLTYFGQFGLMAEFNLGSSSTADYQINSDNFGFVITPAPEPPSSTGIGFMNLALSIGGGVEYSISGNTSLMLGVTFNNGFVDQLDGDASANLNYVALNIGIYF